MRNAIFAFRFLVLLCCGSLGLFAQTGSYVVENATDVTLWFYPQGPGVNVYGQLSPGSFDIYPYTYSPDNGVVTHFALVNGGSDIGSVTTYWPSDGSLFYQALVGTGGSYSGYSGPVNQLGGSGPTPTPTPTPGGGSGGSTLDSNVQDLHDWTAELFSADGFGWGFGSGIVFGGGFLIFRFLRSVYARADGDRDE